MGYIGMCDPKGYGFSAVLAINRVSILADFGYFGHGFCSLALISTDMFLRSHFCTIIAKKINKSPSKIMFTVF